MKIAMTSEMKEIDRRTIEEYGVAALALMENAGVEVMRQIEQLLGTLEQKKVCVFCGKGNNGGDGFVVARHLHNQGVKVKVFLWGNRQEMKAEAAANLAVLEKMELDIMDIKGERDWDKAKLAIAFSDCLVDALVGIGFAGKVEGDLAQLLQLMNKGGKPIVAVDIPSGVRADNGQVSTVAVSAVHTVTLGLPKPGLFLFPGAEHSGGISVADIGIPLPLLTNQEIRQDLVLPERVQSMLPKRKVDAHKGQCGHVLVVAGAEGYTGAAVLAAQGALRSGAGLVTLAVPRAIYPIVAAKVTEVMVQPLEDEGKGYIGVEALTRLSELLEKADVLAIGPGLGAHEETIDVIRVLLETATCPMIIDADALRAFTLPEKKRVQTKAIPVLTPHPGEMSRMTGLATEDINANRIAIARRFAEEWASIVVLKGARTVIAFPDGEIHVNLSGTEGMASGGMGDVLTGVIAGFIGQGLSSHQAAIAGTHLHGVAAEKAALQGVQGMTAGDVLAVLPEVLLTALKGQ
ncbi:NAD(P)H-hydrate dehydratase [Azotosporobacter soli]|uniref:NAD(P)H-hydrate dehydratase n=1 Tax=Azotosporobacter soli TaxID=3055040 RepID=UPI0031FF085B